MERPTLAAVSAGACGALVICAAWMVISSNPASMPRPIAETAVVDLAGAPLLSALVDTVRFRPPDRAQFRYDSGREGRCANGLPTTFLKKLDSLVPTVNAQSPCPTTPCQGNDAVDDTILCGDCLGYSNAYSSPGFGNPARGTRYDGTSACTGANCGIVQCNRVTCAATPPCEPCYTGDPAACSAGQRCDFGCCQPYSCPGGQRVSASYRPIAPRPARSACTAAACRNRATATTIVIPGHTAITAPASSRTVVPIRHAAI